MATAMGPITDSRHKRLPISSTLAPIRFPVSVCYDVNIPTPRLPISLGSIFFLLLDDLRFFLALSLFSLLALGSIPLWMIYDCTQYDTTRLDSLSDFLVSTIHTTIPAPISLHHSKSAIHDPNSITTCKQQKRDSVDRCFPFLRVGSLPTYNSITV